MPKVQPSEDHIRRPLNCFMLYRAEKLAEWQHTQPDHDRKPARVANEWKNEPDHVKEKFHRMAQEVAARHALEHPDYRYRPTKRSEKKPRTLKRGTARRTGSHGHATLQHMSPSTSSDHLPLLPLTPRSGSSVTSSPLMQDASCHQIHRTPEVVDVSPFQGSQTTSHSPEICQPQLAPSMIFPATNLPFRHHDWQRTHIDAPASIPRTIQDEQFRSAALGCVSHSYPSGPSQHSYYMATTLDLPEESVYDELLDFTDSFFPIIPPQSSQAYINLNQRIEQCTERRWDPVGHIGDTLASFQSNQDNFHCDDLPFQVPKLFEESYDPLDLGTTLAIDTLLLEILRPPNATLFT